MISQTVGIVAVAFFAVTVIYAALQDAATLTIRNRLVLVLAGGYFAFAPLAGFGLLELGQGLGTAALVLLATFTLFAFGLIGGGDAKFAAAASLWLGPEGTLAFLVYTMLIGGVLAAMLIALRTLPLPVALYRVPLVARVQAPGAGIPYALAMAPAALLVIPTTTWFALLA
ncbi:A24 family peptidase [Limimaricola soesokkakensis]|uniref:A24 family peptidase n=1 Tax=Limimaricola soesokkakensis TaxID=1343159 RepID=UPI00351415CC